MLAQEVKQLFTIVHDEAPILIKIGDKLIEVKELRRTVHENKVCQVFVPVDFMYETK